MANKEVKGLNVGLYVDITGTFTLVAAKRGLDYEETSDSIDVGHADTYGWMQRIPGQQGATVDWDGVMLLDDATGAREASHQAIVDAKRQGDLILTQLRYPFGNKADEVPMMVNSVSFSAPYDAEATFSISLESAGSVTAVTT